MTGRQEQSIAHSFIGYTLTYQSLFLPTSEYLPQPSFLYLKLDKADAISST